jgi:hypothetical protein
MADVDGSDAANVIPGSPFFPIRKPKRMPWESARSCLAKGIEQIVTHQSIRSPQTVISA